jgi:hypothetical protein
LACCVSNIAFHLSSDISLVSIEFEPIDATIMVIDASIPVVDDDPAFLLAIGFFANWPAGWPPSRE